VTRLPTGVSTMKWRPCAATRTDSSAANLLKRSVHTLLRNEVVQRRPPTAWVAKRTCSGRSKRDIGVMVSRWAIQADAFTKAIVW